MIFILNYYLSGGDEEETSYQNPHDENLKKK
jgi:hypothetical protein